MYHLDLVEKDYFGLRFMDSAQVPVRLQQHSTILSFRNILYIYICFLFILNILILSVVFSPHHRIEQSPQLYASDFRPNCSSHRMKALGWGANRAKGIGSGTIVTSARVRPCCGINPFNSRPGSCVPAPLL